MRIYSCVILTPGNEKKVFVEGSPVKESPYFSNSKNYIYVDSIFYKDRNIEIVHHNREIIVYLNCPTEIQLYR